MSKLRDAIAAGGVQATASPEYSKVTEQMLSEQIGSGTVTAALAGTAERVLAETSSRETEIRFIILETERNLFIP